MSFPEVGLRIIEHVAETFWEEALAVNTRNSKILFVDDEQTIADTLALIFSQRGYDTRAAYSAEQALEITAEWPPDVAILDVVLSKMHGIDLAIFL